MSFFTDPRRLNVALSRAREGLFITGSASCSRNMKTWDRIISSPRLDGNRAAGVVFMDQAPRTGGGELTDGPGLATG
ncbi:hypothetical protein ANCCAN_04289 [Ancylostoma caninum]|uniref:DNA2/NAM7 helicase-like C-terminal domain-containing protein n=1 Tax=Ancylostoma caninum TaxID=29170 RepID=A0A368H2Z8_ANCCA|nr:hypothetical protein ANCCAN_04289 [Ancylostoma caninum]